MRRFYSKKLKVLNKNSFYCCVQLSEIDLTLVEIIPDQCFNSCMSIVNLLLLAVKTIKKYAFILCTGLLQIIAPVIQ